MEKTTLFSLVFVGLISLTCTHNEDDSELLQQIIVAISDRIEENDAMEIIKRNLHSNKVTDERNISNDNPIGNSFGTRQSASDHNGQEYYVNIPNHKSGIDAVHNDGDLYRAVDSFLHDRRAQAWLRWLEHGGHRGTSTTVTPAPTFTTTPTTLPTTTAAPTTKKASTTLPPATAAPTTKKASKIPWCKKISKLGWLWRKVRC